MHDLNDLQFYAAVVMHHGYSPAARALGVPKSRLSKRVSMLEARLGVRLLERTTRRFRITEVGEEVYRHALALMAEAEAIERLASSRLTEPQGLVRIGCPLGVQFALSAALPEFANTYPRLRIQLLVTNRRIDLIEERVDIAIRVRDSLDTDNDLQMKNIGRGRMLLVASPGFLAAWGEPVSPSDLVDRPTIAHSEDSASVKWRLYGPDSDETVIEHTPRISSGDFNVLHRAALDGLGIALMPSLYCGDSLRDGALVPVLPEWSGSEGIVHLVFTSRRGLLPGVRACIDFVAATLKESLGTSWGIP